MKSLSRNSLDDALWAAVWADTPRALRPARHMTDMVEKIDRCSDVLFWGGVAFMLTGYEIEAYIAIAASLPFTVLWMVLRKRVAV